jgi:hypothetical protein
MYPRYSQSPLQLRGGFPTAITPFPSSARWRRGRHDELRSSSDRQSDERLLLIFLPLRYVKSPKRNGFHTVEVCRDHHWGKFRAYLTGTSAIGLNLQPFFCLAIPLIFRAELSLHVSLCSHPDPWPLYEGEGTSTLHDYYWSSQTSHCTSQFRIVRLTGCR